MRAIQRPSRRIPARHHRRPFPRDPSWRCEGWHHLISGPELFSPVLIVAAIALWRMAFASARKSRPPAIATNLLHVARRATILDWAQS